MTTYVDGKPIRYPKAGQWVREGEFADADSERGLIISVYEDGRVHVIWDEGAEMIYETDLLYLHHTGWWWVVPDDQETTGTVGKTWG